MKKDICMTASSFQYWNYIVIFLILLFTTNDESINVFHISISVGITFPLEMFLLMVCLFITILFIRKNTNIDLVLLGLLILRLIVFTVGFFSRPNSVDNISRYFATFLGPIIYLLTSYLDQTINAIKKVIKLAEIATIIISIQTIISSALVLTSGLNISYAKNFIRIPLAPSNTITCYLILMLPFVYYLGTGLFRNLAIVLCLISVVMTRSFSGLVTIALFFLLQLFKRDKKNFTRVILAIVALIAIVILINRVDPVFFERYINRINMLMSSSSSTRSESFNGRDVVYKNAIKLIKENFPFGLGVSYSEYMDNELAHNWVLETFLQEGLLNFIIVVCVFGIVLFRLISAKNTFSKAGAISLVLTLFQAMVEPSFTAFPFDMFFWIFMGSSLCFSNVPDLSDLNNYRDINERE